jgi:polyhydroxybutyrate depolymerase
VHVPPGSPKANRPLILVYHGADSTAVEMVNITDFEKAADVAGDDVVFLQGYRDTWNNLVGNTLAQLAHVNDIGFTAAVLNSLVPLLHYDTRRVAAAGISNGAMMVETLGCHLASRLSLIAPVEGQLGTVQVPTCAPARAISVLEVHGTADPYIPYRGGTFQGVGGPVSVPSALANVAFWARHDHCSKGPITTQGRGITVTNYSQCVAGVKVSLRTIIGGEHNWPSNIGTLVAAALGK